MALISIAADKGGGVTTSAVALAAVWPRQVLLAECDVAGGDLRYRLAGAGGKPLGQDPGVVSLASAVRGQAGAQLVLEHTQQVEGGLQVLVGPAQPEHAAAMASAWTAISGMLAGLPDLDVIADCGRLLGDSPLVPVLRRSDLILLVARDTVEGVAHLRHGLSAIARAVNASSSSGGPSALARTAVLLIASRGSGRTARSQVNEVLQGTPGLADVPVIGVLAHDDAGAQGLSGQWGRRLDRSALIRSARTVAEQVFARVHSGAETAAGAGSSSMAAAQQAAATRTGA